MLHDLTLLDPKLVGALGAASGALIAAIGYYGKLRHERLRTKRIVLFLLLRLHAEARTEKALAEELPDLVSKAIQKALVAKGLDPVPAPRNKVLPGTRIAFEEAVRAQQLPVRRELGAQLTRALSDLARDDPLLAYRLTASLPRLSDPGGDKSGVSQNNGKHSGTIQALGESLSRGLADMARNAEIAVLKHQIRRTALECSVLAWFEAEVCFWRTRHWQAPLGLMHELTVAASALTAEWDAETCDQTTAERTGAA